VSPGSSLRITPADLRLPAAAAALVVFGASAGDGFVGVVAVLLACGPLAGGVATLALAATVARWGTADLGAIAGDQAVLGAAVGTGSFGLMASSSLAGAALVLVARRRDGWAPVAALGVGAAVLWGGAAPSDLGSFLVRAAATVVGVVASVGVATVVRRRPNLDPQLSVIAVGATVVALALAVAS
jgi:hypothetical protein